jgi:hypothetical protein
MKNTIIVILTSFILATTSCKDYLNIVPDNIATLENAFAMRATAERFLFTCYSWMPPHAGLASNPGFMAGDELWSIYGYWTGSSWLIARGEQNKVNTLVNYWEGQNSAIDLYQGIRECNIFLENIYDVPDMEIYEKDRWASEVKFLKAYYHFWLIRMYGPICIVDKNLPISAGVDEVKLYRKPVDDCFDYVLKLIDESIEGLPDKIEAVNNEAGRIDKVIALTMKAYIQVTAASPLFNGNTDYANFLNHEAIPFFNQTYESKRWEIAAETCKEALDLCHSLGYSLYKFRPSLSQYTLAESTITQMSLRNAVCERWNNEVIWGDANSLMSSSEQANFTPRGLDPVNPGGMSGMGCINPTLKMVQLFYTKNGIPIDEDPEWDFEDRFSLRVAGDNEKNDLIYGYTTSKLNFDRENRFYASLGFDGGNWYGQGKYNDLNTFNVKSKMGQPAGIINLQGYSVTGYIPKKLVHFENVINANNITTTWYSWPVMRLANLYLLYAEALNEANGPGEEVYKWIDQVRERAGLKSVVESWAEHSIYPDKYTKKEGMREIIHRERSIELAFEGQRYWDLRRWKKAIEELNGSIEGWDVQQEAAETYYTPTVLFEQTFSFKDYLWPLKENTIIINRNLEQNPGW